MHAMRIKYIASKRRPPAPSLSPPSLHSLWLPSVSPVGVEGVGLLEEVAQALLHRGGDRHNAPLWFG